METETVPETETTSLSAKLMNVVAAPGEVFDEIRARPPATVNWLVPVILMAVTGLITFAISMTQPSVQQQMRELQTAEIQKAVDEGKMPQEQADKMLEGGQMAGFALIFGGIGLLLYSFVGTLWSALVLWIIGAFILKLPIGFKRGLEIAGLSTVIITISFVVSLFLVMIKGDMWAKAAPSLFVSPFDVKNKLHVALGTLNLFYIWSAAVMALGLARVGGGSFVKAAVCVFGYWILIRVALIAAGMGQMVL